jgi:hypothetical protein
VFSRSLPSVCPTQRAARHRLPSRGSREPWFPTFVGTMLYEDCLPTPLGSLRLSLASRYRACFRACVGPLTGSCSGGSPRPRLGLWSPGPQSGIMVAERGGSPTFPSSLFACMPRSQTPVVPSARALTHPELLPLGTCTPSAFPSVPLERYPTVHDSIHFGAPSRGLNPHSLQLRPPIAGLARGGRS